VNPPPEPITHRGRNEIGGILLHEMPSARDGDQGEVPLDQVPRAAERARQQRLVAKTVKLEHGNGDLG